jgi:type IV pilus assembly protein PilY1
MAENEAARAAQLNMAQQPLILSPSLAPNLILTLDSSNSMKRAFVPDALGYADDALRDTRRVKAASFNPLYYDPAIHYRVPKRILFRNGELLSSDYPVSAGAGFDFTRVYVNGFNSARGTLDLSSDYRVAWEYDPARGQDRDYDAASRYARPMGSLRYLAENPAADFRGGGWHDMTRAGVAAYYYLYDPALAASCTAQNDDCYRLVTVSENSDPGGGDERQNFAIWYAFYRNRALAMQSAANLAFSGLPESIRFTWQDLHRCGELDSAGACNGNAQRGGNLFRRFAAEQRANFFAWLGDLAYTGDSPLPAALERAGRFISGERSPAYDLEPGATREPRYACRPSFHLMMRDGLWNAGGASLGNLDGSALSLPDRTRYQPRPPFRDAADGTLADLAFQYWASDAQPALADRLKPHIRAPQADAGRQYWDPRNDPATWQHLVNFFVGIGLGSSLTQAAPAPQWTGDTYSLGSGTITWPAASNANGGSPNNVYDLWHAAINSRGEFFSADSPDELLSAMQNIVLRISQRVDSGASPALATSPLLNGDSTVYSYTPRFSSADWSGDLIKYKQNTANGTQSQVWSAQTQMNQTYGSGNSAFGSRVVKMAASANTLKDFTWANLSSAQQTSLNQTLANVADTNGAKRVDYLRGDRSNEGSLFRARSSVLGDIIDSSPVLVGPPSRLEALMNATNSTSTTDATSYTKFKANNSSRATRIYVGGNDGMLHAFDDSGNETFAFIPSAVLSNLYKLSDPSYTSLTHQYYVDGSPVTADVFFGGAWHTVLVGTLRGGGRAIFALDITDPSNVSMLWEKSYADTGYTDLGYTYSRPTVTLLKTGQWAVITGNGYNSTNDKAVLYAMNIADGSRIAAITVSDSSTAANGLSTPRVADIDGDLVAEYAYAGDLHGNLWRFDLTSANLTSTTPTAAFSGTPLFTAKTSSNQVQPITSAPYLARNPTGIGYIVIFGTGKYIESSDSNANITKAMSLYGIWDQQGTTTPPTIGRSNLQSQSFTNTDVSASFNNNGTNVSAIIRTVSSNAVTWLNAAGTVVQYGWYLDLPLTGEMVVNNPYVTSDVLVASTLAPNTDPCANGVTTELLALNPYTGGATNFPALDMNNDGVVDSNDNYNGGSVAGVQMSGLKGGFTVTSNSSTTNNFDVCGTNGCKSLSGSSAATGRRNWRNIRSQD